MKINKSLKEEILKRVKSYIAEGISHCDEKHSRAEENQKYAMTEQWSKGDILKQQLKDRPAIPWNSIFKVVQAIANREIVERFVPKVFGRSDADAGIANVLDEACKWQREQALSEHLESSAVRSTVISGYGWMHKYWDPSQMDGAGQIVDEDVPVWEMLWPIRARHMNLADRRWHVRGKWITLDEAAARWADESPSLKKVFKSYQNQVDLKSSGKAFSDTTLEDNIPASSAYGWGSIQNNSWLNTAESEIFVVEAEWKEPVTVYRAAVPQRFPEWEAFVLTQAPIQIDEENSIDYQTYLGMSSEEQNAFRSQILYDSVEETIEDRKTLNDFMDRYERVTGEEFEDYAKIIKEQVKYAIITDDNVLDYGDREWGFSYHAITGFPVETRDGMDFRGAVDILKGPQDYKNALLSNVMAMYMSSPKGTLFIEKGAVPNVDTLLNQVASPSGVVIVPDGFLQGGRWQQLNPPVFPTLTASLIEMANRGVEEAFGLSSIDLGTQQDLRRVSGTVVNAARAANNVIVAIIFDGIRHFRKSYGLCNVKLITRQYSVKEIIRIVGEEKLDDVSSIPTDGWGEVIKYDVLIDEQPSSPSELMELVDFLTRTGTLDNWRKSGDITFEDMLRLMPQIPESDKRAMLKGRTVQEQLNNAQMQIQKLSAIIQAGASVPEALMLMQKAKNEQDAQELAPAASPQ